MSEAPVYMPGYYPDLDNETYQAIEAVSKSRLDVFNKSPLHYWDQYVNPDREPREDTPALIIGDAIHKACLEPDLFASNFITIPKGAPKRPSVSQINAKNPSSETLDAISWWSDFNAAAEGKIILTDETYTMVRTCRDTLHRDPIIRGLLTGGQAECSFIGECPYTGLPIKCRTDYLRLDSGMIIDLKSTLDASPAGFSKSVNTYRYNVQEAGYVDIVNEHFKECAVSEFVFIAIEKVRPFAYGVYYLDPDERMEGRESWRLNILGLAKHKEANYWPSYVDQPTELKRPTWANRHFTQRRGA